jgi:hypothetical protein
MKKLSLLMIAAVSSIALSNCTAPTGPNTQRGALGGALLGAAAGGVLGHQSGNALEGAAIGAIPKYPTIALRKKALPSSLQVLCWRFFRSTSMRDCKRFTPISSIPTSPQTSAFAGL